MPTVKVWIRTPHKDIPNYLDMIHLQPTTSTNTEYYMKSLWRCFRLAPRAWPKQYQNVRRALTVSGAKAATAVTAKQHCTFFTHCKNRLTNGAGILILPRNKSQMVSKATCSPRWEAFSRQIHWHTHIKGCKNTIFFTAWRVQFNWI